MRLYIWLHPLQRQLLQLDIKLAVLGRCLTFHRQSRSPLFLGLLARMQPGLQVQIKRLAHGPAHVLDLHGQRRQGQSRRSCTRSLIPPTDRSFIHIELAHMDSQCLGRLLRLGRGSPLGLDRLISNFSALSLSRGTQAQPVDDALRITAGKNLGLDPTYRLQRDLVLQRPYIGQLQLQRLELQQRGMLAILQFHTRQLQLAVHANNRLLLLLEADLQIRIKHTGQGPDRHTGRHIA